MGKVAVIVDQDVGQTFNCSLEIRLGSTKTSTQFLIRHIMASLTNAHRHTSNRLVDIVDLDEDKDDCKSERSVRGQRVYFVADWVRKDGLENEALALGHKCSPNSRGSICCFVRSDLQPVGKCIGVDKSQPAI